MHKVLITGAEGQLGKSLQECSPNYPSIAFLFATKQQLDITDKNSLTRYLNSHKPDCIVNAAAYTQVDKAEKELQRAHEVNVHGVANMLEICERKSLKFVQLSTDYVFEGSKECAYSEEDACQPINYYGQTKYEAEQLIWQAKVQAVILRTSWLYSPYRNNFVKTILRLAKERKEINVVNDQWGSPTYAKDLAVSILGLLQDFPEKKAIYHFANKGNCSWFEFAQKIVSFAALDCKIMPISCVDYPTLAKRPTYSVLTTEKITKELGVNIRNWEEALQECIKKMKI